MLQPQTESAINNYFQERLNYQVTDIDDFTTVDVTYIRYCKPGQNDVTEPVSAIKKIDATTGVVITWAGGTKNFDQIWGAAGDCAALTYSRLT